MATPSPGYSITARFMLDPSKVGIGDLTSRISDLGASLTGVDVAESRGDRQVVDVSFNVINEEHIDTITAAFAELDGIELGNISDRTFLIHLGGKLEVVPKVPLDHRDDMSRAYTPGVARVCLAIAKNPESARNLTIKRNTIAIVTDGSAVLGLGNLGPLGALPVMEGKAALFKHFGNVDAWPICLDTQDADEIVRTVEVIAPEFGGINLEDISAPRCFDIKDRLRAILNIPVFHDDQEGTAIVVSAALSNALRLVGKKLEDVTIALAGVGAAGLAVARLLHSQGAGRILASDRKGLIYKGREGVDESRAWFADNTNPDGVSGTIADGVRNADVFIGVSGPDILKEEDVAAMAKDAIVFALANPDPEVDPVVARRHAAIVATGRSDYPNQINNVLAFPGFFRGLLDGGAVTITEEMLIAAAHAIADVVEPQELNVDYIVPSVFNQKVAPAVAEAVERAARTSN
jgi:malate dehydrogenase (oxaloacetate-decarboxylating)